MTNTDNTTQSPAHPRGAESIQPQEPQDSAAGGVLSPPGSLSGGRADEGVLSDLAVQALHAHASLSEFLANVDEQPDAVRRRVGPAVQSAREAVDRLTVAIVTLEQISTENGGQRLQESGAETPDAVSIDMTAGDNGELVDGLVEVGADVVVHNEQGEEVDRADA